jgi:hypothetical protein
MKRYCSAFVFVPFFLVVACLLSVAMANDAGGGHKKLGEGFTDFTVPRRPAATVGESLGFVALVVGVLALAGITTHFKLKSSPNGLPGYSQAVYMREQQQ